MEFKNILAFRVTGNGGGKYSSSLPLKNLMLKKIAGCQCQREDFSFSLRNVSADINFQTDREKNKVHWNAGTPKLGFKILVENTTKF